MKLEPRRATDRGGYLYIPFKKNIPNGKKGWKLTKCPECRADCWESPLPKGYTDEMFAGKLCTMCGLKKGGNW